MQNTDPKNFTKTKLRYLYRKVLRRIKEKPKGYFSFKRLRGYHGICCWNEGISVDPRKELIPTLIHEVLHDLYPNNWEGWTLRVESKIINNITSYDIYILLNEFFKKLDMGAYSKPRPKKKKIKKTIKKIKK
jgi:hypothetical protein